jgi:hypothetical protein
MGSDSIHHSKVKKVKSTLYLTKYCAMKTYAVIY